MFSDFSCPKCGKRFGLQGELPDDIVCPRCSKVINAAPDKSEIEKFKAFLKEKKRISDLEEKLTQQMLES